MKLLARWLRHLPRRKPARRSFTLDTLRPPPTLPDPSEGIKTGKQRPRRFYDDKAMRTQRDYEDKEIA